MEHASSKIPSALHALSTSSYTYALLGMSAAPVYTYSSTGSEPASPRSYPRGRADPGRSEKLLVVVRRDWVKHNA
jgi:hypothetical protein